MRRLLLLVSGGSILTVAAALLLAGAAVVWLGSANRDAEGYFDSDGVSVFSPYVAVTSPPTGVSMDVLGRGRKPFSKWLFDPTDLIGGFLQGHNQAVATNNDPSKGVFIGIASAPDVRAFLSGGKYSQIKNVDVNPFDDHPLRVKLSRRGKGKELPGEPGSQGFWTQSAHGTGTQTLTWEPEVEDSLIVLMNEDGSEGIDMSVVLGAKLPVVFRLGAGLLVVGGVAMAAGAMMVLSVLGRSRNRAPPTLRSLGSRGSAKSS